jgi:hypothetical protein
MRFVHGTHAWKSVRFSGMQCPATMISSLSENATGTLVISKPLIPLEPRAGVNPAPAKNELETSVNGYCLPVFEYYSEFRLTRRLSVHIFYVTQYTDMRYACGGVICDNHDERGAL